MSYAVQAQMSKNVNVLQNAIKASTQAIQEAEKSFTQEMEKLRRSSSKDLIFADVEEDSESDQNMSPEAKRFVKQLQEGIEAGSREFIKSPSKVEEVMDELEEVHPKVMDELIPGKDRFLRSFTDNSQTQTGREGKRLSRHDREVHTCPVDEVAQADDAEPGPSSGPVPTHALRTERHKSVSLPTRTPR